MPAKQTAVKARKAITRGKRDFVKEFSVFMGSIAGVYYMDSLLKCQTPRTHKTRGREAGFTRFTSSCSSENAMVLCVTSGAPMERITEAIRVARQPDVIRKRGIAVAAREVIRIAARTVAI